MTPLFLVRRRAQARPHLRAALAVASRTLLLVTFFVAAACQRQARDGDPLVVSGNIETTDAQLSFKIPGRVVERPVMEGQPVKRDQLIARLDDVEQRQQLALREAELAAAQATLADLEAGSRPQEIAAAEAALRSAEAEQHRAQVDFTRQSELLKQAAISTREFDAADAQLKVTAARVAEARERLALVREGARPQAIAQARARVQQAQAAVALAQTQVENTRLLSPLDGVVLSHVAEPGEFVSPGTPIVTVADLAHVWVRAYVDQRFLGLLKHGQKVPVRTDAFPDRTFQGTVGFISSEAEFTPKSVQTTKERVKLVYRIKVDLENPQGELKPGMPADVVLGTM